MSYPRCACTSTPLGEFGHDVLHDIADSCVPDPAVRRRMLACLTAELNHLLTEPEVPA
jgi:hypothetical protein